MKPILVLYATKEGHTGRVARQVAASIAAGGMSVDVYDVRTLPKFFGIRHYEAAILAASVHGGEHEPEMIEFVRAHRGELHSIPTAFVSVSLAEAGAEQVTSTPEARAKAKAGVRKMVFHFLEETEWSPSMVKPVAGALLYRQYNPIMRFVMKQIAGRNGGSTDTSRDHCYTDWAALDRFVQEFMARITSGFRAASPAPATQATG